MENEQEKTARSEQLVREANTIVSSNMPLKAMYSHLLRKTAFISVKHEIFSIVM